MIKYFGEGLLGPLPPGPKPISQWHRWQDSIQSTYILYIGAGAVAAGGIISLVRSMPISGAVLKEALRICVAVRLPEPLPPTDQDLR